ncbi:MAG TPA: hypothetical protein VKC63_00185 [Solirubrobacterales bacterium]|nr:hypothetical protein [Solirubrobacterales bacterium]
MAVWRPRIVVGAALASGVAALGLIQASQNGGSKQAPGTYATAERGVVDTTVGGVGHVMTLTGAALVSVPSSSSSGASTGGVVGGSAVGAGTSPGAAAGTSSVAAPSTGGSGAAPADAVFPTVAGHVSRLLVHQGDKVSPRVNRL